MNCKCGSTNGAIKSGVSKKNGRPWKAFKCNDCGEMNWLDANTTQEFIAPATNTHAAGESDEMSKKEWNDKELRDHRRRILISLIGNYPNSDVATLVTKAEEVLKYVMDGTPDQRTARQAEDYFSE